MNDKVVSDGCFLAKENKIYKNHKSIEEKCSYCLAFQCAPVLAGIKPSNLLIISDKICEKAKKEILQAGANYKLIFSSRNRFIYFIYKDKNLMKILNRAKVKAYLKSQGYEECFNPTLNIKGVLLKLTQRLVESINKKEDFPHEIGIFMGYPIEDVISFVKYGGHNYELSGYWKVYHRKEVALRVFKQYDLARYTAVNHIRNGGSLSQIKPLYVRAYKESLRESCQ